MKDTDFNGQVGQLKAPQRYETSRVNIRLNTEKVKHPQNTHEVGNNQCLNCMIRLIYFHQRVLSRLSMLCVGHTRPLLGRQD